MLKACHNVFLHQNVDALLSGPSRTNMEFDSSNTMIAVLLIFDLSTDMQQF